MNQQQHKMVIGKTHTSGAEEWYCPACGRILLINWQPRFMKTVLEPGDEIAIHSGAKGGLSLGSARLEAGNEVALKENPGTMLEEEWLAPWEAWFDEVGFDSLWKD